MISRITSSKVSALFRFGVIFLLTAFFVSSSDIWEAAQAQTIIDLPAPGEMVPTSLSFEPLQLKGILVNVKNPLRFNFLVDKGDSGLLGQPLKNEITRLSKYFLTCLAVPENDLWVNLSPYEKDRIVPGNFGITVMGRDLLEQDYLLKQIMASLSYPENDLGRRFWQGVYRKAYKLYGTTDIPINTFNKVWILPKSAQVYVEGNAAFVVNSRLDVMLEADYKAFVHHSHGLSENAGAYSQVFREVILPQLRQEVNTGKNFALVRQVYNAMILATWYKRHLKDSLLGKMYVGRNAVIGVDIADKNAKEKIFLQYMKAYKKCVYNYIKEDYDPVTQQTVPRKYASGGMYFAGFGPDSAMYTEVPNTKGMTIGADLALATVDVTATNDRGQIVSFPDQRAEIGFTNPFNVIHHNSGNQAMLSGLRKWTMALMLATGFGTAAFPTLLQAQPAKQTDQVHHDDTTEQDRDLQESAAKYASAHQNEDQTPPDTPFQEDSSTLWKDNIISAIKFGLAGVGVLGVWWKKKGNYIIPRRKAKLPAGTPPEPVPIGSLDQYPTEPSIIVQPPPEASENEQRVLAKDLRGLQDYLRDLNYGKPPSPAIPAEEVHMAGSGGGQSLIKMDILASLGFVISLAGHYLVGLDPSWMLAINPVTARMFFVPERWAHDKLHLAAATPLYPKNLGSIWSLRNIMDNLSYWQILKALIPFTRINRAKVDLRPFASVEDSPGKNKFIGLSGFLGSVAVAILGGLLIGLTPFLVPWLLASLYVLILSYQSGDVRALTDTLDGLFGCGVAVLFIVVDALGVRKKDIKSKYEWLTDSVMFYLGDRGLSQKGIGTQTTDMDGEYRPIIDKATNEKRDWMPIRGWKFWRDWAFYRDVFKDWRTRFYKALPSRIVPVYNHMKFSALKFVGHNRAPSAGDLDDDAAHPAKSPWERRVQWVFDYMKGTLRKVYSGYQMFIVFNGDLYTNKIKDQDGKTIARSLGFWEMRRFYASSTHQYHQGTLFIGDLKKVVPDGTSIEDKVLQDKPTNYRLLMNFLHDMGYINYFGYVNPEFKGIDQEAFKKRFPGYGKDILEDDGVYRYSSNILNRTESALFGLASGDAPIIALEGGLLASKGSAEASVRAANAIMNGTILSQKEARAVGKIVDYLYDQVHPFLSRRGYTPPEDTVRSFSDEYVTKEEAVRLKLMDQYRMLEIFREMLDNEIQQGTEKAKKALKEGKEPELAGQVFLQWEKIWAQDGQAVGKDVGEMRRRFVELTVEKFFTADTVSAVMEFADRNDGEFGLVVTSSLDNSITLFKRRQGLYVGLNETQGFCVVASVEDALKNKGRNGETVEKILNVDDREIVDISTSPKGKIIIRSWMKIDGRWTETPQPELWARFEPAGKKKPDGQINENYAPPKHEFKNAPQQQLDEELQMLPGILDTAYAESKIEDSVNRRFAEHFAQLISQGKSSLLIIASGNCKLISKQLEIVTRQFNKKLKVKVVDAYDFKNDPQSYIKRDRVYWLVDDSGSTASVLDAQNDLDTLIPDKQDIGAICARPDGELISYIKKDGGGPDRFAVLGQFWSSEPLIAEDPLLGFQLILLLINIQLGLDRRNNGTNSLGLRYSGEELKGLALDIPEAIIQESEEITGYSRNGGPYAKADIEIDKLTKDIGEAQLIPWWVNRWMNAYIFLLQFQVLGFLAIGHYVHGWLPDWIAPSLGGLLNVVWIMYAFPSWRHNRERKKRGLPPNGRLGPVPLLIGVTDEINARIIKITEDNANQNKPASIGPSAVHSAYYLDIINELRTQVTRGAILLLVGTSYHHDIGEWQADQIRMNETGVVGKIKKGRITVMKIRVKIPIPQIVGPEMPDNADAKTLIRISKEQRKNHEKNVLIDNTVGFMGKLIFGKKLVTTQVGITSMKGRLYNPTNGFGRLRVVSTRNVRESPQYRHIRNFAKKSLVALRLRLGLTPDEAMITSADLRKPGGIDMNSQLMKLNITGNVQNRIGVDDYAMKVPVIKGVVPRVSQIVTVTPDMLKEMLGTGYLN